MKILYNIRINLIAKRHASGLSTVENNTLYCIEKLLDIKNKLFYRKAIKRLKELYNETTINRK